MSGEVVTSTNDAAPAMHFLKLFLINEAWLTYDSDVFSWFESDREANRLDVKVCLNFVSQTLFVYQVTESFSQPFRKIFHFHFNLITLAIWRGFKLHEARKY